MKPLWKKKKRGEALICDSNRKRHGRAKKSGSSCPNTRTVVYSVPLLRPLSLTTHVVEDNGEAAGLPTTSSMNVMVCDVQTNCTGRVYQARLPLPYCPWSVPPTAAYPVVKEGLDTEQAGVEVSLRRKASRNRREPSQQG